MSAFEERVQTSTLEDLSRVASEGGTHHLNTASLRPPQSGAHLKRQALYECNLRLLLLRPVVRRQAQVKTAGLPIQASHMQSESDVLLSL